MAKQENGKGDRKDDEGSVHHPDPEKRDHRDSIYPRKRAGEENGDSDRSEQG